MSAHVRASRLRRLLAAAFAAAALGCGDDPPAPTGIPDGPASAQGLTATALAFVQMAASTGQGHSCGITGDGRLYCWGSNTSGQIGDGTTIQRLVPVPIGGTLRFSQVNAGYDFTCAVTTDGRAYCWGANSFDQQGGQLGDGTLMRRLRPVAVMGGHLFRQVTGGLAHTCGVATDDRLWCWGGNATGQIGDGTITRRPQPVPIGGALRFRTVDAGWNHTCGITIDDRAWCWGLNKDGAVGDSTKVTTRLVPVLVAGGRRYRTVDAGGFHTCAVTLADRAFCWGYNLFGQIGDSSSITRHWPRAVKGGLSIRDLSTGAYHTCAVTTVNIPYCWGENQSGQLGTGNFIERHTPILVGGGRRFDQVSGGSAHTCAKTPAGRGYCWGNNSSGEVGDGTTMQRLQPSGVTRPAS
jgi:alpha-tubulin suppressor-like RCC1 family protein